jgi:hypothetical protein
MCRLRPILNLKIRHLLEVSTLACHHNAIIVKGDRSNRQVHLASSEQISPQSKVALNSAGREGQHSNVCRGFRRVWIASATTSGSPGDASESGWPVAQSPELISNGRID